MEILTIPILYPNNMALSIALHSSIGDGLDHLVDRYSLLLLLCVL